MKNVVIFNSSVYTSGQIWRLMRALSADGYDMSVCIGRRPRPPDEEDKTFGLWQCVIKSPMQRCVTRHAGDSAWDAIVPCVVDIVRKDGEKKKRKEET